MIELIASAVLTEFALWLVFGVMGLVIYPLIRTRLLKLHPSQSSALLLCWLALPFIGSLLVSALLYWPELAVGLVESHCHANSCRQHGPSTPWALIPALALLLWVLSRVLLGCYQKWLPAWRLGKQLTDVSKLQGNYYELPSPVATAFTMGWLRPKIFISEGLTAQCDADDIACILDHEQGHRQRQDNLRHLLAWLFTAPFLQSWVQQVLDDHRLACEQACDRLACARQSAESVAGTLIRVARLQGGVSPTGSSAFADNHTELRIRALLGEQPQRFMVSTLAIMSGLVLMLLAALVNPVHTLLEWFH